MKQAIIIFGIGLVCIYMSGCAAKKVLVKNCEHIDGPTWVCEE